VLWPFWKQKGAAAGVVQHKRAVALGRVCPEKKNAEWGRLGHPGG
jgi:hypothetical protein